MQNNDDLERISVMEKILRIIEQDAFQKLCESVNKCLKKEKKYDINSLAAEIQKYGSPTSETYIKGIAEIRAILLIYGRRILKINVEVNEKRQDIDRWAIKEKEFLKGLCEKEIEEI